MVVKFYITKSGCFSYTWYFFVVDAASFHVDYGVAARCVCLVILGQNVRTALEQQRAPYTYLIDKS